MSANSRSRRPSICLEKPKQNNGVEHALMDITDIERAPPIAADPGGFLDFGIFRFFGKC